MKLSNLIALEEQVENQLSVAIPNTPFHLVKSDGKYLVVLGNNVVAQGQSIVDAEAHFNANIWNVIFFMIFITNKGIKEINFKDLENGN